MVKIINRNAKKLIQLTSDILDVTKIETNNLNLQKELFNLNDLISDIVEDYNNQMRDQDGKRVKIEYDFVCPYSNKDDYGNGGKNEQDHKIGLIKPDNKNHEKKYILLQTKQG